MQNPIVVEKNSAVEKNSVLQKDSVQDIALRLQRMEDIEAIRQLKARYFHACDHKDIDTLRQCFAPGTLLIEYGVIGRFSDREAFLDIYRQMACHPHIIDMHHGQNAQIEWLSPSEARATWDLYFHQINQQTGTLTQLGGFYLDRFIKAGDHWVIAETVFKVTSTLVTRMVGNSLLVEVAG